MPPRDNVVPLGERWMDGLQFVTMSNGKLDKTSLHNLTLFLMNHPHLRHLYWYDEFADEIYVGRPLEDINDGPYPRPLQDHDETALAVWLNSRGLAPSIRNTGSAIRNVAFNSKRNPIVEWAIGLKWDGKKRIDTWLTYYAGVAKTDYSQMVGRRFLISAMARILEPGCKVDTMMVLEGDQGLKKSSLIDVLAGPGWFSDQIGDITSKDASQLIQGIWIMEVAEMDKFSRPEESAVKAFLTRRFDRYRPPYGRNVVRRERRCVFFGTINPNGAGYLKDPTGNRRYWPVKVKSIDLEGIRKDREQLWAEAMIEYRSGQKWWVDEDDEAAITVKEEQDARRDDDVWEPPIRQWINDPDRGMKPIFFTSADVLLNAVGVTKKDQNHGHKLRIAKVLKLLGCEDRNNTNGISGRSWEYAG